MTTAGSVLRTDSKGVGSRVAVSDSGLSLTQLLGCRGLQVLGLDFGVWVLPKSRRSVTSVPWFRGRFSVYHHSMEEP